MSDGPGDDRRTAFEELLFEHLAPAQAFARRLTRDPAEAEDLVQEAALRAYRFFDRFERGTNFKAWLFRIVKNTFVNAYRKRKARPLEADFERLAEGYESLVDETRVTRLRSPEEALGDAVLVDEIQAGLDDLPDEYRGVVHLCLVEGFSYKEAAQVLEVPVGTIMSRLHRGRKALQARLLEQARDRGLLAGGDESQDAAREEDPR